MAKKENINLTKDDIRKYSDQIIERGDDVTKVRQTPDVFIGGLGKLAYLTMTREIIQNAIDNILKKKAIDMVFKVSVDMRNKSVTIEDHGIGIPHGKIGIVFGKTHTSSNYEKQPYEYTAGKNGCGASVTNMLSHKFIVDSYQLGIGRHVEFIEGYEWDKGEQEIKNCEGKQGTTITFIPSEECIGPFEVSWQEVFALVMSIVPEAPLGTTVEFEAIDTNGIRHTERYENKDGIMYHLINMTINPFIAPICINNDNGTMKMELVFTYDTSVENGFEYVMGFNNTCPTESGTHIDGAMDGIYKFFKEYMNKIYLSNQKAKNKLVCSNSDIRTGIKLVISTFHLYAMYKGQSKEILSNEDMKPFVSQTTYAGLVEWSKQNPNDLQKICKYFKEVIEMRMKTDKDKIKLSNNFKPSILSGLPDKYVKPNGKHNTELIIVEGDSALGSARDSRDNNVQGIFPIRGKLPNAFVKTQKDMIENAEISSILQIIGGGYGKNFDLNKVQVSKVIIMADADPDGAHIRTLCLRFLAMYCRPLVEAGMVYAAFPPLFGIPVKKNKFKFFTEKIDYIKYVQNLFSVNNDLRDIKGKPISNKDSISLLYRTTNYANELEKIATNHAIDPLLLEWILINIHLDYKKFSKCIKDKYRFMNVDNDKKTNTIILKGLANDKSHMVFINDTLISECRNIIPYITNNSTQYILNNQIVTLYQLVKEFSKFTPAKLTRFKGLGEMNADMLGVSALRPDGDRLLIRYTFDDVERELAQMRFINTNKDLLLKDLNIDKEDVY